MTEKLFTVQNKTKTNFLNPKFQASSHLMLLYSPVCIGPGRKPRRPVFFSKRGSFQTSFEERGVRSYRLPFSSAIDPRAEMLRVLEDARKISRGLLIV